MPRESARPVSQGPCPNRTRARVRKGAEPESSRYPLHANARASRVIAGRETQQRRNRRNSCDRHSVWLLPSTMNSCLVVGAESAALVLAVRRGPANDGAGRAAGRRLTAALPGASGCLAAASGQSRSCSIAAAIRTPGRSHETAASGRPIAEPVISRHCSVSAAKRARRPAAPDGHAVPASYPRAASYSSQTGSLDRT